MNDGSTTGIFALVRLAADLGLSPDALKAALERAYDMMQQTGNAGLSLHMALARLGYQVDGQALYAALGAFRNRFGAAFENMQPQTSNNPTTQPQPISHQFPGDAPPRVNVLTPQYTPDAMTWRSGTYDSGGQGRNMTQQSVASSSTSHEIFAQPKSNDNSGPGMGT